MNTLKNKIYLIARTILGLLFLIMGLNGFFNFFSMPPLEGGAKEYMMALAGTGYFFPVLKIFEISIGTLLLVGLYVPLALILLAPIALQITLFHIFLDPSGLPVAIGILGMGIYLAWIHKESYRALFEAKSDFRHDRKATGKLAHHF